jgi:hypothetical protein
MLLQGIVWICVAVACVVAGKYVGTWLFGAKKQISGVKCAMQSLSISLREVGLRRIPEALEGFVVGDVDDLFVSLKDLAVLVKSGNETILKELEGTFDRVLGVKLSSPEGRALIEAKLNEAKKNAIEVAKVVGPVVAKAAVAAAVL